MKICPKCGTTNEDGAEFCKACEAPLAVAEQPAKKPGIPRWIYVVCGVIVVLGVIAKIFDSGDAGGSARSNTADVQSSAPAETGASSRAETSRAAETSAELLSGNTIPSNIKVSQMSTKEFVTAYNHCMEQTMEFPNLVLTKQSEETLSSGKLSTVYSCTGFNNLTVQVVESTDGHITNINTRYPVYLGDYRSDYGEEAWLGLFLCMLSPSAVIENMSTYQELIDFTVNFINEGGMISCETENADYRATHAKPQKTTVISIIIK